MQHLAQTTRHACQRPSMFPRYQMRLPSCVPPDHARRVASHYRGCRHVARNHGIGANHSARAHFYTLKYCGMCANPNAFGNLNVLGPVDTLSGLGVDDRVHVTGRDQHIPAEQTIRPDCKRTWLMQKQIDPAVERTTLTDRKPGTSDDMEL